MDVAGGGKNDEGEMNEPADRQPPLHPSHECALRLVGRMSAHDRTLQDEVGSRQPIRILVSDRNSYGGRGGVNGGGAPRLRPGGPRTLPARGAEEPRQGSRLPD